MALTPVEMNKLRWRCRRGLLENDLIIERFFRRADATGETITQSQAAGLTTLMDLADNDLLDLLLGRVEPRQLAEPCDTPEVNEVLALLRRSPISERPPA